MVLPNTCDIVAEPCCSDLFTIADHLLASVGEALDECEAAPCGRLARYVTMGSFDDAITDAISVTFTTVALSPESSRNGVQLPVSLHRGIFQVSIRESGWPMAQAQGQAIVPPDPTRQHEVARVAFGHFEKAYRHLQLLRHRGHLVPSGVRCARASVGELSPLRPTLGVVGCVIPVTIDLPWGMG